MSQLVFGGASSPPAHHLLRSEVGECLAKIPRSPDFEVISEFAAVQTELRVRWRVTSEVRQVALTEDPRGSLSSVSVRLTFEANGIARTAMLGRHAGAPFARDLSVCRGRPRGDGDCSHGERPAGVQGVVSEFVVVDWYGYIAQSVARWMLIRTPSSFVLLTVTHGAETWGEDRGLCKPDAWRKLLEVPVAPAATAQEEVLVGELPTPLDCVADDWDPSCTG